MLLSHTGIEREDDIDALHALDFGDLLIDVFDQHVRHRTVGGGEGHVDANVLLIVYLYVIDQAKIVDVTGISGSYTVLSMATIASSVWRNSLFIFL